MNGAVDWCCLSLQALTTIMKSEIGGGGGEGLLRDDLVVVHGSFLTNSQKTSVLHSCNCPALVT